MNETTALPNAYPGEKDIEEELRIAQRRARLLRRKIRRRSLPPVDPNQRYDIDLASDYLRQSRNKTYEDIKEGRLESIKDGKRRYVPGSEIARRSRVETPSD